MKLYFDKLESHLQQGLQPIYLLSGALSRHGDRAGAIRPAIRGPRDRERGAAGAASEAVSGLAASAG